jgi:hypothetical protein
VFVDESLPPLVDDDAAQAQQQKKKKDEAPGKNPMRPGGRPLADGCFTVELDLSHFVRVHEERKQKTLMIIVADRSGSMKGKPWRQVRVPPLHTGHRPLRARLTCSHAYTRAHTRSLAHHRSRSR